MASHVLLKLLHRLSAAIAVDAEVSRMFVELLTHHLLAAEVGLLLPEGLGAWGESERVGPGEGVVDIAGGVGGRCQLRQKKALI